MTAVSGANLRSDEAYWALSGPVAINRSATCRACRESIAKGSLVMVRDGRKLRFFYHVECFTGDADPRTQENGSYQDQRHAEYHRVTAPDISSLSGPRACLDPDGRPLGREVFKPQAPSTLGSGKWSVAHRGYEPSYTSSTLASMSSHRPAATKAAPSPLRNTSSKQEWPSGSIHGKFSATRYPFPSRSPSGAFASKSGEGGAHSLATGDAHEPLRLNKQNVDCTQNVL
jgi:hypothetical protein